MVIFIAIAFLIAFKLYQKYTCGTCSCNAKMINKVGIVTGSNTGIGYETAKDLAERGAKVILACRDVQKGTKARDRLIEVTGNVNIIYKQLDLSSLKSVREFADDIIKTEPKLDVLINNAGTGKLDNSLTEDNLPIEAQVNHFGPFLLTMLLLPLLKSSAPSRIINVASIMHKAGKIDPELFHKQARNSFEHMRVYSNTKLANILFTKKLSQVLKGTGVTANSLHPGAVSTDIFRDKNLIFRFLINVMFKTPREGAQTSIHLAISPELIDVTGKYFSDCKEINPSKNAQDNDTADKLWQLSKKAVFSEKKKSNFIVIINK